MTSHDGGVESCTNFYVTDIATGSPHESQHLVGLCSYSSNMVVPLEVGRHHNAKISLYSNAPYRVPHYVVAGFKWLYVPRSSEVATLGLVEVHSPHLTPLADVVQISL